MLATHPVGYLRFLISIAALGLLAALLLLPAPVRAQVRDSNPPTLLAANVDGTSLKLIYERGTEDGPRSCGVRLLGGGCQRYGGRAE